MQSSCSSIKSAFFGAYPISRMVDLRLCGRCWTIGNPRLLWSRRGQLYTRGSEPFEMGQWLGPMSGMYEVNYRISGGNIWVNAWLYIYIHISYIYIYIHIVHIYIYTYCTYIYIYIYIYIYYTYTHYIPIPVEWVIYGVYSPSIPVEMKHLHRGSICFPGEIHRPIFTHKVSIGWNFVSHKWELSLTESNACELSIESLPPKSDNRFHSIYRSLGWMVG